jgi:AraC-like DNA-binding protein
MSKQAPISRLIVPSLPALYQHILSGPASYQELGNRVLQQIRTAHAFRQVEEVRELAGLLINNPIREFQLIAQYYLVWCKCRELEYHGEVLDRIIEQTQTHKAQALLSRGTFEISQGNPERAFCFYSEGLKAKPPISEHIGLSLAISVLKASEGFHQSALRDMEALTPLIKHAEPRLYYDFLNSYAVELIEAGRLHQAENVSAIAVSSPFGPNYREWLETLSEIRSRRKHRSTISIPPPQERDYELAAPEPITNIIPSPDPRVEVVIDFMNANLERKVPLGELASVANLSVSRLSHLFKTQTEMSPGEYLIRLRMGKARQLLATSLLSIKQVMAKAGYYNKSHFARHFRRSFHFSPSEYRKSVSRLIAKSDYLARLSRKTG